MHIKRLSTFAFALIFCLLAFVGCSDDTPQNVAIYYDVTFNSAGGTAVESVRILEGSLLSEPEMPQKEGYIFDGWYKDEEFLVKWDFSVNRYEKPQDEVSLKLYAKFITKD